MRWAIILRAYSWPASLAPILIGSVLSYRRGSFSWADFALTLAAGLLLHSAANVANTYFDHKNGVDQKGADDVGIVANLISPEKALRLALFLFTLSALAGLYLAVRKELFSLLPVSAAGFALAWFYTAAPAYKYRALGELGIFLCFGPLLVAGTVLIQTGKILPEAALASIPTGLLIVGILFANNLRDLKTDSEKGIKTLPGLLGEKRALVFYFFLVLFPYPAALYSLGFSPAFLITAVSLPMAVNLLSLAKKGKFHVLVRENAKFVGIFGLLFSVSLFFGK